MTPPIQDRDILRVRLRPADDYARLADLKEVTQQLQQTLAAVEKGIARDGEAAISYAVVEAEVGSLTLGLQPVAPPDYDIDPTQVVATFAADLVDIRHQTYRSGLTTGLARHYLSLVRALASSGTTVEYEFRDQRVAVDSTFRQGFEVALRERVAEDVTLVGLLQAVNAHQHPFRFNLYPKLPGAEGIECRFPPEMLPAVAELLKSDAVVRVNGTGHFLPIGTYPHRLDVSEEPIPLPFDAELLRSYVHRLLLVPAGLTAAEYLHRNREAAGLADQA